MNEHTEIYKKKIMAVLTYWMKVKYTQPYIY